MFVLDFMTEKEYETFNDCERMDQTIKNYFLYLFWDRVR